MLFKHIFDNFINSNSSKYFQTAYIPQLQIKKWDTELLFIVVVLVTREHTRDVHKMHGQIVYVPNNLICYVGTWSQIFDVRTILDSSTCLFCVVRFLVKNICLWLLTSTSQKWKLRQSFWCTIPLKFIAL